MGMGSKNDLKLEIIDSENRNRPSTCAAEGLRFTGGHAICLAKIKSVEVPTVISRDLERRRHRSALKLQA